MVRVRVRILLTNMKKVKMCTMLMVLVVAGLGLGLGLGLALLSGSSLGLVENNIISLTGLFKSTLTVTLTQNITLTL
jgi:hypothetical protein